MDLSLVKRYNLDLPRSSRKSVYSREQELTVTAHHYVHRKRSMFVGCSDGKINIWKPKTEFKTELVKMALTGHLGTIFKFLDVRDEGGAHLLLSCSADRTIRVWEVWQRDARKRCIQTMVGHGGSVTDMAFVKGLVISCSTDNTVRIWKSNPGRTLTLYPFFETVQVITREDSLRHCPVSVGTFKKSRTDSMAMYIGDAKGRLLSFVQPKVPVAGTEFEEARGHQKLHNLSITHTMIVPSEGFVVTLSYDNTVQVHDCATGNGLFAMENPKRCRYTALTWDPDHQQLILADEHGHVQFWNIFTEKCLKTEQLKEVALQGISVHPGARLMVSTADHVEMWKIERDAVYKEFSGHEGALLNLVCVDNGLNRNLYSASQDNSLRCWDSYDLTCLGVLQERDSELACMAYLPGSIFLATGHDDGCVKLWNIDSGSSVSLEHHKNTVCCMAVAHTRKRDYLISGSYDSTIGVWDITKKRALTPVPEHAFKAAESEVLCVLYNPNHQLIYSGGNDCVIAIWDIFTRQNMGYLRGHREAVTCLCLDGQFLFSGSDDGTIRAWDLHLNFCVMVLKEHKRSVRDLIVIPGAGLLMSCSLDGNIFVWDYTTQKVVQRFVHPDKRFRCLYYNAENKNVFAGTEEANILVFSLDPNLLPNTVQEDKVDYEGIAKSITKQNDALVPRAQEEIQRLQAQFNEQMAAIRERQAERNKKAIEKEKAKRRRRKQEKTTG